MKFSEKWLRSYVNPQLDSDALAHLLTMAGLEVEEQQPVAPAFTSVVVAEVLSVRKHEGADRLNVCEVNVGEAAPLQIVCGAPNVRPGIRVPCARIGAVLPGEFKIKQAKVRGVESFGMLCSARELGVSEDSQGLLILPEDAPVGQAIRDYLDLDDQLFTLKLTPNRTDCLSLRGLSREVAALTGSVCQPIEVTAAQISSSSTVEVQVVAQDACPRYLGRVVEGVNATASTPAWMVQRLERSGLRSISPLVDVTNYILLEIGQPLHAFDQDKLSGGISVRFAVTGETLQLLNDKTIELTDDMLVIADEKGPLALAGIMGGAGSAVSDTTRSIFLESAYFSPSVITGKSRRLGFGSDSSYRFERGIDFGFTREAIERATVLITDICGGSAGPIVEVSTTASLPLRPPVALRYARVNKVLGIDLAAEQIVAYLQKLGLPCVAEQDQVVVTPPSFRYDIEIEVDLIEEIARLYGYDAIPVAPARSSMMMLSQPGIVRPVDAVKQLLVGRDYQEVINYAFVDEAWEKDFAANDSPIRLQNPIASQMSVMRTSLIGGLISNLQHNINRKQARVRLFEVARTFLRVGEGQAFNQPEMIAGLAWGGRHAEQWGSPTVAVDFYDVKADVEALLAPSVLSFRAATHPSCHPGRCAEVILEGAVVGVVGELHPQWVQKYGLTQAPVIFEVSLSAAKSRQIPQAAVISKLQPVRRDLALVVNENVQSADLISVMQGVKNPLVKAVELFDVYRGKGIEEGKKSLAFKVILQDTERTLTDVEVESVVSGMLAALQQNFDAKLRS